MDIRQIEFFVAVAEELNFTRAAENMYVTQSGLSSSIRGLERELRTQLFDRTPRTVTLTSAGHAFLPRARRMLVDAHAAQRELAAGPDEVSGVLGIGTEQCLGDLVDLPDLLAAFQERFPGVSVRFEQLGSQTLLDRLHLGELNAALLAQQGSFVSPLARGQLESFEMARDGFELVMAPTHALASRDGTGWTDFEEHAFVDFDTTWTARRIVDSAFASRRLVRRTAFSVNDVHMLFDLVHRGLGVALIPASLANKSQADGLVRRPFVEPDLEWAVHFVTTADSGPPARLLAKMMFTSETMAEMRKGIGGATAGPSSAVVD